MTDEEINRAMSMDSPPTEEKLSDDGVRGERIGSARRDEHSSQAFLCGPA